MKATALLGVAYTTKQNVTFEAYVYFPLAPDDDSEPVCTSPPTMMGLANANWGPQDASIPTSTNSHEISIAETRLSHPVSHAVVVQYNGRVTKRAAIVGVLVKQRSR